MEPHVDTTVAFTVPTHVLARLEAAHAHYRDTLAMAARQGHHQRGQALRRLAAASRDLARAYDVLLPCFLEVPPVCNALRRQARALRRDATDDQRAARETENGGAAW